jgi:hypothetical protein
MKTNRPHMLGNKHNERHGLHKSPEYCTWQSMKTRCSNPKHKHYYRYGGRGINYDPSWEYFENFYADMGKRPDGYTLDRIDNNKGYSKDNCKWASRKEQSKNTISNILITYQGKTKCAFDWAKETGINYQTIIRKFKKGVSPEKIFINNEVISCFA